MMSNAHFYGAPAAVYERIDGIAPDERKHGGVFAIDQVSWQQIAIKKW